ncbi:hypothetical protein ACL02S_04010 [Nocardia sp. 004]|uniref:hypothetical protein n=1 Tax=Nocardia sp. 004 TaxID=3385978 RepID=UPI0039A094CE
MTLTMVAVIVWAAPMGWVPFAMAGPSADIALPRAHAHNDYIHDRPLRDALTQRFTSVEADVYPGYTGSGGGLRVAHFPWEIRHGRTLDTMYLQELDKIVHDNGGTVLSGYQGEFQLMIEFKFDPMTCYRELEALLHKPEYADLFTRFVDGHVVRGPVTVVILPAFVDGSELRDVMAAQPSRQAFLVGSFGDLGKGYSRDLMPEVNADWAAEFSWNGVGPMPAAEHQKLVALVQRAHAEGKRVRFWGAPDDPGAARQAVWDELFDVGVDRIATDHLSDLAEYLSRRS